MYNTFFKTVAACFVLFALGVIVHPVFFIFYACSLIAGIIFSYIRILPNPRIKPQRFTNFEVDESTVIWTGRPSNKAPYSRRDLSLSIPSFFIACLFLDIGKSFYEGISKSYIFLIVFVVSSIASLCFLYLAFGRLIAKKNKAQNTKYYIINDKAVINISKKKESLVYEIPLSNVTGIAYEINEKGLGSIFFNPTSNFSENAFRFYADSGIVGLDNLFFVFVGIDNTEQLISVLRQFLNKDVEIVRVYGLVEW